MAAHCLPKKYSTAIRDAFRNRAITPDGLRKMTSEERRTEFAKHVGDENARETNLLFEKKLMLKDQQKAMVSFVNDLQGLNETAKRDMVDQIMGMERMVSPKDARGFLEDLAAKKLGATVSHAEAAEIYNMAEVADASKKEWETDLSNNDKRVAFGTDLVKLNDRVNQLKGNNMTAWDHALNVLNLPKQLSTTADFSATLVQLSSMVTSGRFWEGFLEQFKYFASEDNFTALRADIITHPYYDMAVSSKLGLSEISDRLRPGEELIQSKLLEGANQWLQDKSKEWFGHGAPNAVRAVDRAFVGYINYVRWKTFTDLVDNAKLRGEDVRVGSDALRDMSENINTFTGRGNIGLHDEHANAVPFLNLTFWTIRKVSSTLTLMSPVPFMKASPTARIFAMRQTLGTLAATASLYGMARALGYEAPLDPSDAHFGWIKVGKTWFNPMGDKPTYARLLWRLASGHVIDSAGIQHKIGEGFPKQTREDLIERFARGKLGPTASIIADGLYGEDFMGNPMNWDTETLSREASARLVPMGFSSVIDTIQNDPDNTVGQILSMTSIFGVSSYVDQPRTKVGLTRWGDSIADAYEDKGPDLDKKLAEVQQRMKFPPNKINGVKLTDSQYHDYITIFGQQVKSAMTQAIASGEWDKASDAEKIEGFKNITRLARRGATTAVQLNSVNGNDGQNNDIFEQSTDKANAEEGKAPRQYDLKKDPTPTLKEPVHTEEEMKKQWADFMIKDYDYGRMKETNPLAYLGYQAVKDQGVASYFKTHTNALGITNADNADPTQEDYPLVAKIMKEAGIDPKSAKGKIMLGPEFGEGKNTYTLEHELMHRGMMELIKTGFNSKIDDHLMIQGYQHLYGNDKHSSELEMDMMGNNLKPQYRNDEKEHKEFANMFKEDIDSIQNHAKKLISKDK